MVIGSLFIVLGGLVIWLGISRSRWPEPSLGVGCQDKPKFEDFSENLINATLTKIDVDSNTMAREEMKPELLAATGSAVNFAGKYVVISHNCGHKCQKYAIIELEEGKILAYGLRSTGGIAFQANSRLVMTSPDNRNSSIFYEFKDDKLNYLCEQARGDR